MRRDRFALVVTSAVFVSLALLVTPMITSAQSDAGVKDAGRGDARSDAANGHFPPEVIQRIVRQNFGRFKLCYTAGLRRTPGLSGRISTKFVIETTGHVSSAGDGGSDLPDEQVKQCIFDTFTKLEFPPPEGGHVTVIYPLIFTPGD